MVRLLKTIYMLVSKPIIIFICYYLAEIFEKEKWNIYIFAAPFSFAPALMFLNS